MKQSWAHKNLLTRKFVAALVLCLFVMKGLSFMGMTASLAVDPLAHQQFAASIVLGSHCDKSDKNSDHSGHHIDHSQCCVFCGSASKEIAIIDTDLTKIIAVLSPEKDQEPLPVIYADRHVDKATHLSLMPGWISTAPPTV